MAMNSVNTNMGAMVALQSLNRTNDAMESTQKRISTGLRVSDAQDDGAAFAIAQTVRADVAGLSAANDQLGSLQGLLTTTTKVLEGVSGKMAEMRKLLVNLSNDSLSPETRKTYSDDFNNKVKEINLSISDATYNGRSLLATDENLGADVSAVRNENGEGVTILGTSGASLTFDTAINISTYDAAAPGTPDTADPDFSLAAHGTPASTVMTAADARAILSGTGTLPDVRAGSGTATPIKSFDTVMNAVSDALSKFGGASNYIKAQITYNSAKLDAMEGGLGALVDADLAKESARLQALQIRQQLGTQSLGIANQAPQALLSLFKG